MTLASRTIRYLDRDSWWADRRRGAPHWHMGASSAWLHLVDPWALWSKHHKAGDEGPGQVDDGEWWEEALAAYASDRLGLHCDDAATPIRVVHPEHDWLRPSPDALAASDELDGLGVVDIKTAFGGSDWPRHGTVLDGWAEAFAALPEEVARKYCMQGALQCAAVAECSWFAWIVALHYRDVRVLYVRRDTATEEAWVQSLSDWREQHLLGGDEPPIDGSADAVRYLAHLPREGEVEGDDDDAADLADLAEAKASEKAAKERKRAATARVLDRHRGVRKLTAPNGLRLSVASNGAVRLTGSKR